ncbi:MAG: T9SS type A sorting domain-containing protein [Bacteroidetes bacterium]|nr:T9SS type A sorting domain-containing protein [Bacteroidota bacterium]
MNKYIILSFFFLASVQFSFCQQIAVQDSLALVDLYYAVDGPNSILGNPVTNWLITPVSEWSYVGVNNNRVVIIGLGEKNLHGVIPPSIGNLTQLIELDLSGNYLEGPIPESIGKLVNLEYLFLEQNQLTSIPDSIGYCVSLIRIYLHMNQLAGSIPASIGNLSNLTNLSLSENNLTGEIPSSFGNMASLEALNLQHNQLTGNIPEPLCNLSVNLYTLCLSHNLLSGIIPDYIGNLTNINQIWLDHNNFYKNIPSTISNLQYLVTLDLSHNHLTGEIPQNLGAVGTPFPAPVFHFNDNQLSGEVPASLLNYLKVGLYIQNNHVTEMPDLSNTQYGSWAYMQNNCFTFEDIEPNISIDTLYYIPQDSVLYPDTLTALIDSPFVISSAIGCSANHYQWFKNGDSIAGATDSVLYFPSVAWSDSGLYTCRITNDIVTDLTLWRHTVTLWVTDTLTGIPDAERSRSARNAGIRICPNPVKQGNDVVVYLPQDLNFRKLRVYNIAGVELFSLPLSGRQEVVRFASGGLERGVYMVKAADGENRWFVRKVVVE